MKPSEISILAADDHPILLKGLTDQLKESGYVVLEGAINGAQALGTIVDESPTIALLDIEMPLLTGFEVINKCIAKGVDTKFVILTSHKEKAFVLRAKKYKISGYLLKDEPYSEIEACIRKVANGGTYFSQEFDAIFNQEINPQLQKIKFLSPSERTIVRLVANGRTTKEISASLSISRRTVEKHRANIIAKLDLPKRVDALSVWSLENKELILSL
ncbi:MAG: response regulator transcription factor [Bacteroidetes bacterium]|nr:response regulator transcription factor [Bacteroidota bacterium]